MHHAPATTLIAAALVTTAHAGSSFKLFIIDFEGFDELTPITTQYADDLGATFSTPGEPENPPIIAVEGSPIVGWSGDGPASSGSNSLTDPLVDGSNGVPNSIAIDFDPPVTSVSLFVIDIDGNDTFAVRAFDGETEVDSMTVSSGEPGAGNNQSTEFNVAGANITSVLIEPVDADDSTGWGMDFVTFTRPCEGVECGPRVQVAQESAPGVGDFDDNILGEVLPYAFSGTPGEFYGYGVPDGSSFNGPVIEPVTNRSHLVLSAAGGGVALTMVHDAASDGSGGDAEMMVELFGDPDGAEIAIFDDPNKNASAYTGEPGESVFTAHHNWSSCCTDGWLIAGFGCAWTAYVQFTDVNGNPNDATIANLDEWVAYSADGVNLTLAIEPDRRVRLMQLPTECTGDLDADLLVGSTDLNLVLAQFGCTQDCCADIDGDGDVDSSDLNLVLAAFGGSCQ